MTGSSIDELASLSFFLGSKRFCGGGTLGRSKWTCIGCNKGYDRCNCYRGDYSEQSWIKIKDSGSDPQISEIRRLSSSCHSFWTRGWLL